MLSSRNENETGVVDEDADPIMCVIDAGAEPVVIPIVVVG